MPIAANKTTTWLLLALPYTEKMRDALLSDDIKTGPAVSKAEGESVIYNLVEWEEDRQDKVIQAFAKYATVPVINMETITHPCQEMALALTLQEKWGETDNKNFLLDVFLSNILTF